MTMDVSPLVKRLREQLEAEFPGWLVNREDSGRWRAVRPGWGALYGQSAPELRERLRRWRDESQGQGTVSDA
jgi:hypothetical protein